MLVYMIGITIKKETTIARLLEENQINSKMIMEATGVEFANIITGTNNCSISLKRAAKLANKIPVNVAKKKPDIIRTEENKIEAQKLDSVTSSIKRLKTEKGDGKSISRPICILNTCQMSNQKRIAHNLTFPLLLDKIEFFTWHLSTNRIWILLKQHT